MKRKVKIFIFLIIVSIVCVNYFIRKERMQIYTSQITISQNDITLEINVVLNTFVRPNYYKTAQKIVNHCIENDFDTVRFSYDKGYPSEIVAKVYLIEKDLKIGKSYFEFCYTPKENEKKFVSNYNIVDNEDNYEIKIKKQ